MSKAMRSERTYGDPILPLGLLVVGLLALCVAVLYPARQVLGGLTPLSLLSGVPAVPPATVAVVACLLVLSAVATLYAIVLLFVRL
jgi:hypothetical protein